jgi:hypothetical protein
MLIRPHEICRAVESVITLFKTTLVINEQLRIHTGDRREPGIGSDHNQANA